MGHLSQIPTDKNLMSPMGDMNFAVAIGAIEGYESFRKFGMNSDIGASTLEEMWTLGTIRTMPTVAGVVSLVSDSAEDDENEATPPGTGAWTIRVEGLDADYNEISELVALQGTTPVNTTNEFLRCYRAYCVKVGTAGYNVGNITGSIGGNAQIYVEAQQGQTHLCAYTVPAGKVLLVSYYAVGVGRMAASGDANINGEIRLYDETSTNNYQSWRSISDIFLYNGQSHVNSTSYTALPAKTDLRMLIFSSSATQAHGVIGGYLIDTATQGSLSFHDGA